MATTEPTTAEISASVVAAAAGTGTVIGANSLAAAGLTAEELWSW